MGCAILIVSMCMGKSTRIQRVNPDIHGSRVGVFFLCVGGGPVCVCETNLNDNDLLSVLEAYVFLFWNRKTHLL